MRGGCAPPRSGGTAPVGAPQSDRSGPSPGEAGEGWGDGAPGARRRAPRFRCCWIAITAAFARMSPWQASTSSSRSTTRSAFRRASEDARVPDGTRTGIGDRGQCLGGPHARSPQGLEGNTRPGGLPAHSVKARDRAGGTAWLTSDADVAMYMDVDLPPTSRTSGADRPDRGRGGRRGLREAAAKGFRGQTAASAGVHQPHLRSSFSTPSPAAGDGRAVWLQAISRERRAPSCRCDGTTRGSSTPEAAPCRPGERLPAAARCRPLEEDTGHPGEDRGTAVEDLKGIWRLRRGGVPRVAGRG